MTPVRRSSRVVAGAKTSQEENAALPRKRKAVLSASSTGKKRRQLGSKQDCAYQDTARAKTPKVKQEHNLKASKKIKEASPVSNTPSAAVKKTAIRKAVKKEESPLKTTKAQSQTVTEKRRISSLPKGVSRDSNGALKFEGISEFRPNMTPREVLQRGAFGGCYFNPKGTHAQPKSGMVNPYLKLALFNTQAASLVSSFHINQQVVCQLLTWCADPTIRRTRKQRKYYVLIRLRWKHIVVTGIPKRVVRRSSGYTICFSQISLRRKQVRRQGRTRPAILGGTTCPHVPLKLPESPQL